MARRWKCCMWEGGWRSWTNGGGTTGSSRGRWRDRQGRFSCVCRGVVQQTGRGRGSVLAKETSETDLRQECPDHVHILRCPDHSPGLLSSLDPRPERGLSSLDPIHSLKSEKQRLADEKELSGREGGEVGPWGWEGATDVGGVVREGEEGFSCAVAGPRPAQGEGRVCLSRGCSDGAGT